MNENDVNTIGRQFSLAGLIGFVAAPVFTRLLVSFLSTLDDALFVSRYCGQNALAAFSVGLPWFMFVDALGMLFGAVSVVCSIKMGEKKIREAKSDFTTMLLVSFVFGIFLTLFLILFLDQVLLILGETEILFPYAKTYMSVSRYYIPLLLTSYIFNNFYVIAGKPSCAMISSSINTFCQFFFDWLFIVKMNMGIVGVAYANMIGLIIVTVFGLFFYSNKNNEMHFVRLESNVLSLLKNTIKYGRMQFITSLSISLSSYIANRVQLDIGGEMFVAAYTIVNNVTFMFLNSFFGLVGSTSPIASYAYGEKNPVKLSRIIKQTTALVTGLIIIIISMIYFGRNIIVNLYLTETSDVMIRQLALKGFVIYPVAILFFGYNVFVQEFMNVVGNNKASLFLSIVENVILNNIFMIILPRIFGMDSIWYVFLIAEGITFMLTGYVAYINRNIYGYGKDGIATFVNN